MQQAVLELISGSGMKQLGVEIGLLCPQSIELGLDHCAVNVQVVAFIDAYLSVVFLHPLLAIARTHSLPVGVPLVQPLANCAAVLDYECLPQFADSGFQCTAVVVFFIGFAVALEASALVDVEQGARELFGF